MSRKHACDCLFETKELLRRAHGILPEMETARATLLDLDTLDPEALKALVREQHAQLLSHEAEMEHLKLLTAKLQRLQFGRRSDASTGRSSNWKRF